MEFIFDPKSISFIISILFALAALIFGYRKHNKKFHLYIFFYMASAYIIGMTIYPSASLMFYSFQKSTFLGESILDYQTEIGLAGLIMFVAAIIALFGMLKKQSNKKKKVKFISIPIK
jgi:hypothetical protein